MGLKWTESLEIAIALDEAYPDVDPKNVNFVDLRKWILELEEFGDAPEHCGERVLEGVQLSWIEERE